MTTYTVSFFHSKVLKQNGFPQQTAFYHNTKSKEVSNVADLPIFKGMFDLYISAPVDAELDKYLPDGVELRKNKILWTARYAKFNKNNHEDIIVSRNHENPLDAKADLVLKLFKEHLITF